MATAHIESLAARHAALDATLAREAQRPMPDQVTITRLKREKLKVKEAIQGR